MSRLLIFLLFAARVFGADVVTLAWNPNTETNLVGYRVYAGTNSRQYQIRIPTGLVTTQAVTLPFSARWYFAVTATNNAGLESAYSAEVQWEPKPEPPVMLGESWVRVAPIIERSVDRTNWVSAAGLPTWFPATNAQEFFMTRQLTIERVERASGP